ncbi:MAG: hypothetical protein KHX03_09675 [Clostridium sp.]|nr:hypothetical protein [Clostridium sp.]
MDIIVDLKNAIRKSIYELDKTVNFNFEEIQTATYPYVFFYISNYRIIEHIDPTRNAKLDLQCVLEYASEENPKNADLWSYEDNLRLATKNFEFLNTKLFAQNLTFKIVDGVLQMTFDLTLYVKETDKTELMKELQMTIKGA